MLFMIDANGAKTGLAPFSRFGPNIKASSSPAPKRLQRGRWIYNDKRSLLEKVLGIEVTQNSLMNKFDTKKLFVRDLD